jgi:hypothetical protein
MIPLTKRAGAASAGRQVRAIHDGADGSHSVVHQLLVVIKGDLAM